MKVTFENNAVETAERSLEFTAADWAVIRAKYNARARLAEQIVNEAGNDLDKLFRLYSFHAVASVMSTKNANEWSTITHETINDQQRKKARFIASGCLFENDFFKPVEGHSAAEQLLQDGLEWLYDYAKAYPGCDWRYLAVGRVPGDYLVVPMVAYIRLDNDGMRHKDSRNGLRVALTTPFDVLKTYIHGKYSALKRGAVDATSRMLSFDAMQEKAGDACEPMQEDANLQQLVLSSLERDAIETVKTFIQAADLRPDVENNLLAIVPYFVAGWPQKAIAARCGLSCSVVSRRIQRLRDMIDSRSSSPWAVNALDELHAALVL